MKLRDATAEQAEEATRQVAVTLVDARKQEIIIHALCFMIETESASEIPHGHAFEVIAALMKDLDDIAKQKKEDEGKDTEQPEQPDGS